MVAQAKVRNPITSAAISHLTAKTDMSIKNVYGDTINFRKGDKFYAVNSEEENAARYVYWDNAWQSWRCTCWEKVSHGCKHRDGVKSLLVARRKRQ